MEELSIYHRAIGKEEGERLLALDGRDGCYLIRNSETMPEVYCLCVLCKGFVYTYRLRLDITGSWTADAANGVEKRRFRKIGNLIEALTKPNQGIVIPLCFPVTADGRSLAQRIQEGLAAAQDQKDQRDQRDQRDQKDQTKILLRYKIQCTKKK